MLKVNFRFARNCKHFIYIMVISFISGPSRICKVLIFLSPNFHHFFAFFVIKDEIVLLCKGAETAVLNIGNSGEIDKTNHHIHDYALVSYQLLKDLLHCT